MHSLSAEDMRRIVSSGDLFLLVDVRPLDVTRRPSIPGALRIPNPEDIASRVFVEAGHYTMPIVVLGDGEHSSRAARQLEDAGFLEVWTCNGHPEAWASAAQVAPDPRGVMSDPDAVNWNHGSPNQVAADCRSELQNGATR